MYLKSVEVHGFKSFASKMVFQFGNGITAIVGPNGSGKSNVADAVRWVLGEQSAKQLRGSKMEDVIFAGTKIRKAQSFAYVALTLDNSDKLLPIDYEEVVVARRVYRSGESEYLINGANCRLKDVQDLFLDTGIGKEGYSIIGQGQIEKILSGRPEDRRELFDEAAGITKFKKRKALSLKNLEEERANLLRLTDILGELEKQVHPLEEQAKKAKLYLSYREELKKYETEYFISEYDKAEETRKKIKSDYEITEKSLLSVSEELEKGKAVYEEMEGRLTSLTEQHDGLSSQLSEKKIEREKAEGRIKLLSERLRLAKENDGTFFQRLEKAKAKFFALKEEEEAELQKKEVLSGEIEALRGELENLQAEIESLNGKKNHLLLQKTEAEEEGLRLEKERAKASGLIASYTENLDQLNIRRLQLNQKLLRNQESLTLFKNRLLEAEGNIGELTKTIKAEEEGLLELHTELAKLKKEKAEKEKFHKENEKERLRAKAVLSSLKDTALRYEGYGSSVKHVMELKKNEAGIIGVVADIIKVKESYELAIETAIGGAIQNIVTDKEETAKRAINFLKERKLGRATFLPLDSIALHNPGNFGGALNEKGILGVAASLTEFEPKFAAVVHYILGRTLIADNMENATKIARKYKYSLRIVTLDGEQLNPGGSLSGGAYRNANHLLGRAREIEEKEKEVSSLKERSENLINEALVLGKRMEEKEEEAEIKKSALSELRVSLKSETHFMKQHEERIEEHNKVFSEIDFDLKLLDKEKEEIACELSGLKEVLSGEKRVDSDRVEEILKDLMYLEERLRSRNEDLVDKKMKLSSAVSNLDFFSQSIDRIKREKDGSEEELEELNEEKERTNEAILENEASILKLTKEVELLSEKISLEEEERIKLSNDRTELQKEVKSLLREKDELAETKNRLDKEGVRLSNLLERAESGLTTLVDYMREEYGLTYSLVIKDYEKGRELPAFTLKKLIGNQKNLIKELGTVNVNAIEEYKEVSERYSLLTTQYEDVLESEKRLRKIIEELDLKMTEQFNKSFKEINESFSKVFSELFGGGGGSLSLIEGEEVLEAGIKIKAEPPGKKLQNMMQLSGGEKSLTAIALLFAIQNLKPSPFCLLDEIEAALDDSNVVRFADYLNKLTKNTQFIVITHRRGTMNAASTLYGITMQEKGVSTMVSVNLIDEEIK